MALGPRARRELSRNWPVIGIAVMLWTATVILRTPALGIDAPRVFSIILTSGSMLLIGMMIERIRRADQDDEERLP